MWCSANVGLGQGIGAGAGPSQSKCAAYRRPGSHCFAQPPACSAPFPAPTLCTPGSDDERSNMGEGIAALDTESGPRLTRRPSFST